MKDAPSPQPRRAKKAPGKQAASSPGHTTFRYRPQFGLVIVCADEAAQQSTYDRLLKMGLAPKVVVV